MVLLAAKGGRLHAPSGMTISGEEVTL